MKFNRHRYQNDTPGDTGTGPEPTPAPAPAPTLSTRRGRWWATHSKKNSQL